MIFTSLKIIEDKILLDVEEDCGKIWKIFFCEGCHKYHGYQLNQNFKSYWQWDGNEEYPTFFPSMIVKVSGEIICHSQIVNMNLQI